MSEMIERAARAICVACGEDPDTLVLRMESLPERVSIPRWQSVAHDARAAFSAALDLTPAEHLRIAEEVRRTEVRTGGMAYYRDVLDAVLAALKAASDQPT